MIASGDIWAAHKYHPFLYKPPRESHPLHNRCDWITLWFRNLLKHISGLVTHVHHQLCSLAVEQVARYWDYVVGIVHHCDNIAETSVSALAAQPGKLRRRTSAKTLSPARNCALETPPFVMEVLIDIHCPKRISNWLLKNFERVLHRFSYGLVPEDSLDC